MRRQEYNPYPQLDEAVPSGSQLKRRDVERRVLKLIFQLQSTALQFGGAGFPEDEKIESLEKFAEIFPEFPYVFAVETISVTKSGLAVFKELVFQPGSSPVAKAWDRAAERLGIYATGRRLALVLCESSGGYLKTEDLPVWHEAPPVSTAGQQGLIYVPTSALFSKTALRPATDWLCVESLGEFLAQLQWA